MALTLTVAPGETTAQVLGRAITAAQDGNPLAPVEVVVPSGLAGVTLRRAAAGERGWANVRFSSLPQLVERLCTRALALALGELLVPLTADDRRRALQTAVADSGSKGLLVSSARRHRATAELLERVVAELDDVQLAQDGNGELGELYTAYRTYLQGSLTPRELLELAATVVTPDAVPTILVATGNYGPAERALLDALGGRLTAIVPPAATPSTQAWLGATATTPKPSVHVVIAPDAEEEVRLAVRRVVARLRDDRCRPERLGIAYTSAVPYARLLAEQLVVAGVPHHVPSQRTLGQTVAGRTVTALLDLHERDYPRAEVLRWLNDGPVLTAGGERPPVARWERLSRDAGISRGIATWRVRLARYAADQRDRTGDDPEAYERQATHAESLLAEVESLRATTEQVLAATTWLQTSSALTALVRRVLGTGRAVDRWQDRLEQGAYDAVLALVQALAIAPGPVQRLRDELAAGLEAPVVSGTTLGRGVLCGGLRSFVGSDLDLLVVLGCTEDALPARQRESTVLRDAERQRLSPDLATVATRRREDRERWEGLLASAPAVVLSYGRADTRAQRRQFPSPWLLEQASRMQADPDAPRVTAKVLDQQPAPWREAHDSFVAALLHAPVLASPHELDVALSLTPRVSEVEQADPRFARGLAAARARRDGVFGEWTGQTGQLPESLAARVDDRLSATSLQVWATCPAQHLYGRVLGFRALEDRGNDDRIDGRERGSLVHSVLEDFIRARLGTDPDLAWSANEITAALASLETKGAALREKGLTGLPVLWESELARLRRTIVRVLEHDSRLRRTHRWTTAEVEQAFGRDDRPHLTLALPTQGEVAFAGFIDRVDTTADGGLVVMDYKTGRDDDYKGLPKAGKPDPEADLVLKGTKLQLLLYALAAKRLSGLGDDVPVEAWFWFLDKGELLMGAAITPADEQRLTQVLDLVVGGIRGGTFPQNPGKEAWLPSGDTWENCLFCNFQRVCPTTRAEQWASVRTDPAVTAYSDLVDPPPPAAHPETGPA